MIVSLPHRVTMSPEVLFRDLDGEAVMLDLNTERYFGLDEVGARMWQLLAEHGHVETVVQLLLAEYEVEEDRLRQDLANLIAKMADAGLIIVE